MYFFFNYVLLSLLIKNLFLLPVFWIFKFFYYNNANFFLFPNIFENNSLKYTPIENRIYIRGELKESLGMNFFSPFQAEREFKVYKSCKCSQIICIKETVQQNGRFTLFSSKFPSNIYSILYGWNIFSFWKHKA